MFRGRVSAAVTQAVMLPLLLCRCCRRVIFHGPVSEVQQHFQSIGFDLPPRMDVPSWLVEITTPSGEELWQSGG
jgi:hypothetical protein